MIKKVGNIFVFGSNLAGRHGKGAAKFALQKRGAIYGQGEGLQGESYAIPTKDGARPKMNTLPLDRIQKHVHDFCNFAGTHPELTFELTPIGCGLAGYEYHQIAPMFRDAPSNVIIPDEFKVDTSGET
jgi:hypothetical protein